MTFKISQKNFEIYLLSNILDKTEFIAINFN